MFWEKMPAISQGISFLFYVQESIKVPPYRAQEKALVSYKTFNITKVEFIQNYMPIINQ